MATKYPIILVHGVIIKDFRFLRAFGRIENVLKKEGYTVYTAKIDGMGTIENNAQQLKDYILDILEKEKCEKVNIIAHSKGGLDSKYMIEELEMDEKVASLTALCTPFKGSPIASKILAMPEFIIWASKTWFNVVYKIFGDKHPDSLTVCKQLERVDSIESNVLATPKVYVQSYSTTMDNDSDDFVMGIPYAISKYFYKEESTDGMVPEESASFGQYKGNAINDSISHIEIADFMINKSKKEKVYAFYIEVCKDLASKGF